MEEAILAAGCFWGVEHLFKDVKGVLKTDVGYTGGLTENPTYEAICSQSTGHQEAVRILYNPDQITYLEILHFFFEIHDFTQIDGQGNDRGEQYLSVIFYGNIQQHIIATEVIKDLKQRNYKVTTLLKPSEIFWPAENYHQQYYEKTGGLPYCHAWRKIF